MIQQQSTHMQDVQHGLGGQLPLEQLTINLESSKFNLRWDWQIPKLAAKSNVTQTRTAKNDTKFTWHPLNIKLVLSCQQLSSVLRLINQFSNLPKGKPNSMNFYVQIIDMCITMCASLTPPSLRADSMRPWRTQLVVIPHLVGSLLHHKHMHFLF